jgi:cytidine deaminase
MPNNPFEISSITRFDLSNLKNPNADQSLEQKSNNPTHLPDMSSIRRYEFYCMGGFFSDGDNEREFELETWESDSGSYEPPSEPVEPTLAEIEIESQEQQRLIEEEQLREEQLEKETELDLELPEPTDYANLPWQEQLTPNGQTYLERYGEDRGFYKFVQAGHMSDSGTISGSGLPARVQSILSEFAGMKPFEGFDTSNPLADFDGISKFSFADNQRETEQPESITTELIDSEKVAKDLLESALSSQNPLEQLAKSQLTKTLSDLGATPDQIQTLEATLNLLELTTASIAGNPIGVGIAIGKLIPVAISELTRMANEPIIAIEKEGGSKLTEAMVEVSKKVFVPEETGSKELQKEQESTFQDQLANWEYSASNIDISNPQEVKDFIQKINSECEVLRSDFSDTKSSELADIEQQFQEGKLDQQRYQEAQALWQSEGNFAIAHIKLEGISEQFQKSYSDYRKYGDSTFAGYSEQSEGNLFYSASVNGRSGSRTNQYDTERNILIEIDNQLQGSDVQGEITIYTELNPCSGCRQTTVDFQNKYPRISINFIDKKGNIDIDTSRRSK